MISYEHCPICNSASLNKILTAKDHTVSGELFEIWQCAHCSLRITQNVPSAEEIGRYYKSENYISHTETNKGIINWMYLRVRRYTISLKRKFVEQETGITGGSLLDIGAGTGAFLNHMKQKGWRATGVEPDDQAISVARSRYGLELHPSNHLFGLEPASFDAITLWHVLEHVHDLDGYMRQLRKLLKKDGRLIIAVPNYTSKDAEHYGQHWAAYDVPRHLYHFSPASMHALSDKYGFQIKKIQPMWFDSFYVSLLSEKYKKGSANLLMGFVNGLRSNSRALSNFRKASSVIYVLQ